MRASALQALISSRLSTLPSCLVSILSKSMRSCCADFKERRRENPAEAVGADAEAVASPLRVLGVESFVARRSAAAPCGAASASAHTECPLACPELAFEPQGRPGRNLPGEPWSLASHG